MPLNTGEEGDGREGDCEDVFDLDLDWECLDWGEVGEEGWIVRCDELGQTQRRRYGLQKSDYDGNPRPLHSSECRSLTSCVRTDLRPDLRHHRLPLPKDKVLETFPRLLGFLRARPRMRS